MALRFCISSSGINLTKPLITVLGFSSPTSTSSTYNESASGCFLAVRMSPTLMSSRPTSTIASAPSLLEATVGFFSFLGFSFFSVFSDLVCSAEPKMGTEIKMYFYSNNSIINKPQKCLKSIQNSILCILVWIKPFSRF